MGIREFINKFKANIWLSKEIESNWINYFLYLLYISIRPIFTLFMMVFIYVTVATVKGPNLTFGFFILTGQAFYNLIVSGTTGISSTLWSDREHFRTLKYIYISPLRLNLYLIGRGFYYFLEGLIPFTLSLFIGSYLISFPLFELNPNFLFLILNIILGMFVIISLGLLISSFIFFSTHYGFIVIEAILGSLLLFGNVLFPIEILPYPLYYIGYSLPITYWLDLNRELLLGKSLFELSDIFNKFLILTIIYFLVSIIIFNLAEKYARKKGMIDITTAH